MAWAVQLLLLLSSVKKKLSIAVYSVAAVAWDAYIVAGHGKLTMADGSYYEGEFDKGEINGHGFRFFASSRNVYSGEFHMGEMHGQGVMRYADGSTYEGEWENNKRQGL